MASTFCPGDCCESAPGRDGALSCRRLWHARAAEAVQRAGAGQGNRGGATAECGALSAELVLRAAAVDNLLGLASDCAVIPDYGVHILGAAGGFGTSALLKQCSALAPDEENVAAPQQYEAQDGAASWHTKRTDAFALKS